MTFEATTFIFFSGGKKYWETKMRKLTIMSIILVFLLIGCGIRTMPTKDPWYAKHFFIMQDVERNVYHSLSTAGKIEFQKLFWEARPIEAKQEFDNRMAYIANQYKRENYKQPWNTDRARIYLLNGPPAFIEQHVNDNWAIQVKQGTGKLPTISDTRTDEDIGAANLEVWAYHYKNQIVYYGFIFEPPNKWKQADLPVGGYRYMGELEAQNKIKTYGIKDEVSYRKKLEELKTIK